MSANGPNTVTKPRKLFPFVESTPPEIWSQIFRHAAGEHIDEDLFFSSAVLNGVDWKRLKEFKKSLVTRRSLARVCKAWSGTSHPFLYEYLFLGRGRSILPLRDAISASRRLVDETGEEPSTAFGWWTRRLDVHMRDDATEKLKPLDILKAVADIIACLPNLQILTFSINGRLYDLVKELPANILGSCPKSLKAIHWDNTPLGYCLMPTIEDWTSFLENHPKLVSIRYKYWATVTSDTKIKLDTLKILHPYNSYSSEPAKACNLMNFDLPAHSFFTSIRVTAYCHPSRFTVHQKVSTRNTPKIP
ncbi:hypothetical protein GALMADRAFT_224448 [Galerina marginata CBS 339.88]|uniref:F-box domain-containing protein n=1 Tax=Galerina marginata (strain CBS 339.88) TaxID=685588 RepID=A0A067T4F7_GALM3|nr:hypothetical protein GALMADRAFT_224448 [Galerina marginata CBS 339.88]